MIQNETQEIIEFPWVVFDPHSLVRTGPSSSPDPLQQVIDKQQLFVKPQWVASLPRFCTQLTGITDAQLETAPPLVSAVRTVRLAWHPRPSLRRAGGGRGARCLVGWL